jgi:hypothetical protein
VAPRTPDGRCTLIAVSREITAVSPCENRIVLMYWGVGPFTLLYKLGG